MPRTSIKETLKTKRTSRSRASRPGVRCGLCGKPGKLRRAECCGNWVCDDEHEYVLFSYALDGCDRNHRRYTLCGFHFNEGHKEPDWRTCRECRGAFSKVEDYVHFGTNEFNFVKLENPPPFEPAKCRRCGDVISLARHGYAVKGDDYFCEKCVPMFAVT